MGTILYVDGDSRYQTSCLYVSENIKDNDVMDFYVINGAWDGRFDKGKVFFDYTERESCGWKCYPVNQDDFKCENYNDYNEVIERFLEIKFKNI